MWTFIWLYLDGRCTCSWSSSMEAAVWTSLKQFTVTSSTETFWQKESEQKKIHSKSRGRNRRASKWWCVTAYKDWSSCPFNCWCLLPASLIMDWCFKVVCRNIISQQKRKQVLASKLVRRSFSAKRFCA